MNVGTLVGPRLRHLAVGCLMACTLTAASHRPVIGDDATAKHDSAVTADSAPTNDQDDVVPEPLRTIEGISEYRLDNGVQVLLFPDASKEVVTVNMTIFVGSRHEGYGEAGMAHLLEHMLFKGTPTHPDVPGALNERGARFNGTTWLDRTNYYETLPATTDNLEFAIALEADRLVNSNILGEDLLSEMTVVRNEFERGENSPQGVLMQRIESAAFDWHNYGKSTIGNQSDIERVPIVNLRRFYKKFYRPDNVMLIVAGKFDPDAALRAIQRDFGSLPVPKTPIDETYTVEPPKDGERTIVLRRVGDVQLVGAAYHVPSGSHADHAAVMALANVLNDEPSGRLYKGMVQTDLASNASAFAYGLREPGLLMAMAEIPTDNSLEQARQTLLHILETEINTNEITSAEVDRAKQQMLKQRELEATDSDRIAVALSDWAAQGDWRLYFLFRDAVEALTVQQVRDVAAKYLVRNNRTVGLFIPTDEAQRVSVPEGPDLNALLADYKGREAVKAGEAFDPDPIAIESRVIRGELVGGIGYALLPKVTRGDSATVQMVIRFGTPESLVDRLAAAELLGSVMSRGTEDLSYQELQDEYTRLRANVSVSTSPGLLSVAIQSKKENLAETIDLVGKVLRQPRLDETELDVLRRQIITSLESSRSEPNALAVQAARRALAPYPESDIRYVQTLEEQIEMYQSVTIDELRDLHARFLGNQDGSLVAVGNFDAEPLLDQFRGILGDWVSDEPYRRIDRPALPDIPGELIVTETPDKSNALLYGGQQYDIADTSAEYAALTLGNYVLGGGSLSSRLADRIRQKDGLSYGVASGLSARPKDRRADLTVYAITNPINKDRLLDAMTYEIAKLVQEGVTPEELTKAKSAYLQGEKIGRTDDRALAGLLLASMFNDRTLKYHADHEQQIADATIEQVNAAVQKFIDVDALVISIAGDFANAAAEPAAVPVGASGDASVTRDTAPGASSGDADSGSSR